MKVVESRFLRTKKFERLHILEFDHQPCIFKSLLRESDMHSAPFDYMFGIL